MAFQPVELRGRILPNYATIERDDRIPFWRELGKRVHEYDCKFIRQLSHAGRQRDIGGIEYEKGLSATDKPDPFHGFECERMTPAQIREIVQAFARGARRVREAARGEPALLLGHLPPRTFGAGVQCRLMPQPAEPPGGPAPP